MEVPIYYSFVIFFFFFLYRYKFNWPEKFLIKDSFLFNLLNCSFCSAFWLSCGLFYFNLIELSDIFVIPIICLFIDLIFRRLNV